VVRVYLPPDANCLLSVIDHCLRKPPLCQRGDRRQAPGATVAGNGKRRRALRRKASASGTGQQRWRGDPDLVMACCGDVPRSRRWRRCRFCASTCRSLRSVSSTWWTSACNRPASIRTAQRWDFVRLFHAPTTGDLCVHGYPWLIHRLTYRRTTTTICTVRGYKEEGTITTAFDIDGAQTIWIDFT